MVRAVKGRARWRALALSFLFGAVMLGIGFASGYILKSYLVQSNYTGEEYQVDKITVVQIEHVLEPISELSTYSDTYTGNTEGYDARQIGKINIPFTQNHVDITYTGVIKVGYDVSEIKIDLDERNLVIHITLPEPKVNDNYIILDSLIFNNENNFLNPIQMEDLNIYFDGIQELELEKSKKEGIMEKAEEHMKALVQNALAEFSDYEVVFD